MESKKIIICAGGASIPYDKEKGLNLELKQVIQRSYAIGLNSFYKYGCETTFLTFVDGSFYQNHRPNLKDVPLIIGKKDPAITEPFENTILLPRCKYYLGDDSWYVHDKICMTCRQRYPNTVKHRDCPKCKSYLYEVGFYHHHLVGMFALTLAIALGFKEIFLLGYDCCAVNGKTHFYQDSITEWKMYGGVGQINDRYKTAPYNDVRKLNNQWYEPYKDLKDVRIYNVSEQSVLTVFPKIDYMTFYANMNNRSINQEEARKEIRQIVLDKTKKV